jgi:hypothetical protein
MATAPPMARTARPRASRFQHRRPAAGYNGFARDQTSAVRSGLASPVSYQNFPHVPFGFVKGTKSVRPCSGYTIFGSNANRGWVVQGWRYVGLGLFLFPLSTVDFAFSSDWGGRYANRISFWIVHSPRLFVVLLRMA